MLNQYFELLNLYRKENNYIIKEFKSKRNVCYVFFSSQGIYDKPYDIEGMKNVFINERFEWKGISSNRKIIRNCSKQIFIRDIGKELYQRGINDRINSINELVKFISDETKNMDVYLVGTSSGGYIAFIASQLHNVKRVYSVGGLVNVGKLSTYGETINRHHLSTKYINASPFLNRDAWIIHIFGSDNDQDIESTNLIRQQNIKKCLFVPINSNRHAPRPSGYVLIKLLTCNDSRLAKIAKHLKNRKRISAFWLSIYCGGGLIFLINHFKKYLIYEKKN